ncbi:MAG TPA: glycerophosphodiester phosphodiesterase family protein [Vicinamibacterales bacterium]|nr:glycerophosphodiester phosphodiesterase family protein [Vicinamibacterales bacterium]
MRVAATSAALAVLLVAGATGSAVQSGTKGLVAHRGASAYAPEHTLAAYELAIEQRADFVEQDLGVTKDGVLVCIHDLSLERTTNVEEVFPGRSVEMDTPTGKARRWLVADFTLAEIKQLDAGSWFDAKFAGAKIPTFQEAIDAIGTRAGLYPELKDPAFYRARGVSPEKLLADVLRKNRLVPDAGAPSRVIIQSFDDATVKRLAQELPTVPRVWLVEAASASRIDSPEKVREVAAWATGLGPNKGIVAARPELVKWAHAAGLTVTPWTFRSSNTGTFPSVRAEMEKFLYEYGVDAVFTDNPDQFPRK